MAWLLGTLLFAAYGASAYWSSEARDKGLADFAKVQQNHALALAEASAALGHVATVPVSDIDMSTWSPKRIEAYQKDVLAASAPEAVLRIPGIDLAVPVFTGTGETNLNRGAGRIEGTPPFGEWGNTGVAAHRDGFFRALRNVHRGDVIRVDLPHGSYSYKIVSIRIVDPSETSVLNDSPEPMITLVTCYPFYFVGAAPKRFIVHAVRTQRADMQIAQPVSHEQPGRARM